MQSTIKKIFQNNWILPIIVLILMCTIAYVLLFNDDVNAEYFDNTGALTQLMTKGPQDFYLTTNNEKYVYPRYYYPYYFNGFNRPTYNNDNVDSNYKKNENDVEIGYPFYGITPFVWGNGTRIQKWNWPYYDYIYNWYYDSYGYGGYLNRY